ncbi:MAG: hypothetical protein OEV48_08525 [Acidobacteriota bacterium]|jgi:hypothetical protein|nr:hypothetical protein [Acidobacteriota bacterium]
MKGIVSTRRLTVSISSAAGVLALAGAWLRPVWHDELYTLALARLPVGELMAALEVDSGPPLHYLLCHLLFVLVGWQEGLMLGTLMVRLPSVLAFASIPWVVWKARPVGDRGGRWGPLLVVAWLPLLYFGTEARAYALLALVNAIVWIRGPRWIERGGRWTFCFAVLAACLPLLHYMGFVSFLLLPSLAFFVPRQRRRALVLTLALAALPALAWMPVMLGAPADSMGWVATESGPGRPGLATVSVLSPAGPFPALFEASGSPLPPWVSVVVLGTLIGGAALGASRLRRNHDADAVDAQAAVRLTIALLPAVGLAVLALGGIPVYFAGRTESMAWAFATALIAITLCGLPAIARRVVAGSYIVVGVATIAMWIADLPKRPPAPGVEVGRVLASRIDASDRVVVAGLWQMEVRHGLAEGIVDGPAKIAVITEVETIPRSQAGHPGWFDREAAFSPEVFDEAVALSGNATAEGSRIWLVWSPALPLENTFFPAFAGWQREKVAGSPIITVDLLTPPAAEGGAS